MKFIGLLSLLAAGSCLAQEYGVFVEKDGSVRENCVSFWERANGREGKYSILSAGDRKGLTSTGVIYLKVDDKLDASLRTEGTEVAVEIVYYDGAPGSFNVFYDSTDPAFLRIRTQPGAWKVPEGGKVMLKGDGQWKSVVLPLPMFNFRSNRLNGADLRIDFVGKAKSAVAIAAVRLKKQTPSAAKQVTPEHKGKTSK